MRDIARDFEDAGFAVIEGVCDATSLAAVEPVVLEAGATGGSRCLLRRAQVAALADDLRRHPILGELIPRDHVAVQCTYFEKSTGRNWLVGVHQDQSIPVAARVSGEALRGWSEKEGEVFVQPGEAVLSRLIAVRLHLDPCGEQDGPLRVVAGSHRAGVLTVEAGVSLRDELGLTPCVAGAGDVLVMQPLLLHSSSKSTGSGRRRVLHFLFGPPTLPEGLQWPAHARANAVKQTVLAG